MAKYQNFSQKAKNVGWKSQKKFSKRNTLGKIGIKVPIEAETNIINLARDFMEKKYQKYAKMAIQKWTIDTLKLPENGSYFYIFIFLKILNFFFENIKL